MKAIFDYNNPLGPVLFLSVLTMLNINMSYGFQVFLPGMQEIREMHKTLSNNRTFKSDNYKLIPLHSSLSNEEQAEVFR